MGFWMMISSFILGGLLIGTGVSRRTEKHWRYVSNVCGIILVVFAVYLGFPK